MIKCRRCNSKCKPSKALLNQLISLGDDLFEAGDVGSTQSRSGKAILVDCYKCVKCGHSFIPNTINNG